MASYGDIDTCPICYDEIDIERGDMVRMPGCEHKMHQDCYASFVKYHMSEYNRSNMLTLTGARPTHNGDVLCPYCREMVVKFEQPPRTFSGPIVINLRDIERSDAAMVEIILQQHRAVNDPATIMRKINTVMCIGFVVWITWCAYRLKFIYDGEGIGASFGMGDYMSIGDD